MVNSIMTDEARRYLDDIRSSWKIRLYFFKNLPSAWWWGFRVKYADADRAEVTIPYNWRTKNPFRSIYFAALAGAGELSTGVLANLSRMGRGSISMLVVHQETEFVKKADTLTTFTCEDGKKVSDAVQKAVSSGEPVKVTMLAKGTNTRGETVANFSITWSFKLRQKGRSAVRV